MNSKCLIHIIIFFLKISMEKYTAPTKRYKSTSFIPRKKKIAVLADINYQELVVNTLKEKYIYFIVGFGVLLGIIAGTSYFMINHNSLQKVASVKKVVKSTKVMASVSTPILLPTKIVAKTVSPTFALSLTATKGVTNQPKEVVEKPKVDLKKAAEAARAKPGTGSTKYIVKKGDTLWKIAEKAYKSGFNYKDVVAYNKIANPNTIVAGQEILLPTVKPQLPTDPTILSQGGVGGPSDDAAISATMTDKVTDSSSNYTVVKGDTLWTIAARTLGDGFSWADIAKANGITDPVKLEVGTKLVIPR
jgi:nucleoid-associated protein YgaU